MPALLHRPIQHLYPLESAPVSPETKSETELTTTSSQLSTAKDLAFQERLLSWRDSGLKNSWKISVYFLLTRVTSQGGVLNIR